MLQAVNVFALNASELPMALGVASRGAQALHRACRPRAHVHGRDFVVPDDVRALLVPTWSHRLSVRPGTDPDAILHEILAQTPLPD